MELSHTKIRLEIQAMHTAVCRARVQTCRKLISEVKKISNKKTLDKLKHEKNTRKVQRLTDEVHILRLMKPNLIAKFCLSHTEESIEALRKQPNVTPKLRALAKVSSHKLIKPLVDKFREKFPKWQETLPKLLEKDLDIIGLTPSKENNAVDENHLASNENLRDNEEHSDVKVIADENSLEKHVPSNNTVETSPKSNEYSNKINAKKKANSKKVPSPFSLKFSPHKLKTIFKKRKLSKSETCDEVLESAKKISKSANNVKNSFIETDDFDINDVSQSNKAEGEEKPKKNNQNKEDSFFNRSLDKIDKCLSGKEEKTDAFAEQSVTSKHLISSKKRDSEQSVSLIGGNETYNNNVKKNKSKKLKIKHEEEEINMTNEYKEEDVTNNNNFLKNKSKKPKIKNEEEEINIKNKYKEEDVTNNNNFLKNKSKKQKIKHEEEEINIKNEYNQSKNQNIEKKLETVQQQEDPFFMTKDNKKYMTFGKIEEPKVEIAPLSLNRSFQKPSSKVWNDDKYFRNTGNFNRRSTKIANKFEDKNSRDRNMRISEDSKERLHPSWQAKKRTSTLVPFQGKKISFDD